MPIETEDLIQQANKELAGQSTQQDTDSLIQQANKEFSQLNPSSTALTENALAQSKSLVMPTPSYPAAWDRPAIPSPTSQGFSGAEVGAASLADFGIPAQQPISESMKAAIENVVHPKPVWKTSEQIAQEKLPSISAKTEKPAYMPRTLKDMVSVGKMYFGQPEMLSHPLSPVTRPIIDALGNMAKNDPNSFKRLVGAFGKRVYGTTEGLVTPENAAIVMAAGGLGELAAVPETVGHIASVLENLGKLYFIKEAAEESVSGLKTIYEGIKEKDPEKIGSGSADTGIGIGTVGSLGKSVVGDVKTRIQMIKEGKITPTEPTTPQPTPSPITPVEPSIPEVKPETPSKPESAAGGAVEAIKEPTAKIVETAPTPPAPVETNEEGETGKVGETGVVKPTEAAPTEVKPDVPVETTPKPTKIVKTAVIDKSGKIIAEAPEDSPFMAHDELKPRVADKRRVFVADNGELLNRTDAMTLAKESGQVPADTKATELHSEDLRAGQEQGKQTEPVKPLEQPVTAKGVTPPAEVKPEPSNTVSVKQQRDNLLKQVNDVIDKAKSQEDIEGFRTTTSLLSDTGKRDLLDEQTKASGIITFDVPGDGVFKILNTKEALTEFRDKVQKKWAHPLGAVEAKLSSATGLPPLKGIKNDYDMFKIVSDKDSLNSTDTIYDSAGGGTTKDYYYREIAKRIRPDNPQSVTVKEALNFLEKEIGARKTTGDKIVESIAQKSDDAAQRLKDRVSRMSVGIDPTIVSDAVTASLKPVAEKINDLLKEHTLTLEEKEQVGRVKEALIQHHENYRQAEIMARAWKDVIDKVVSNTNDQMNMVHAYQQGKNSVWYKNLTLLQKSLVDWCGEVAQPMEDVATKDLMIAKKDIPEGQRYLFQWWRGRESGEPLVSTYGKFSKSLPQAKEAIHPTYEEGISTGLKPASTNLGEILGETLKAVMGAKETRSMYRTLMDEGVVQSWSDLAQSGDTTGFVRYHDTLLDQPIAFKAKDGTTILLKTDAAIDENIMPFWKAYRENPTRNNFEKLNYVFRGLKFAFSLFHPITLGWQEVRLGRIPFKNIPRGLAAWKDMANDPYMKAAYIGGLEKTGDPLKIFQVPGTKWIFDVVQKGMKTSFVKDELTKAIPDPRDLDTPEGRKTARQIVKTADAYFSGEDIKRAGLEAGEFMNKFYFSPTARRIWQNILLSPTWQRQHLLEAKNISKSIVGKTISSKLGMKEELGASRSIYLKSFSRALGIYTAANMYNYYQTKKQDGEGKMMWQNPSGFGFSIRAPYNAPDGNPMYIHPFKSMTEVPEMITALVHLVYKTDIKDRSDALGKFKDKLTPVITATEGQFYPAYNKYENIRSKKGNAAALEQRGIDLAEDLGLPISFGKTGKWIGEEWTKGKSDVQLQDIILQTLGAPTKESKPEKSEPKNKIKGLSLLR